MRPMSKLYLTDDEGNKIFGEGPYRLMLATKQTGSLRKAAQSMNMAYSKAHKIMLAAEEGLGYKLLCSKIGGALGGGSTLTEEGKELMAKYEEYKRRCKEAETSIYMDIFRDRQ